MEAVEPGTEKKTILKHGGGSKYIPEISVIKNKEEFMRKCMAQFMVCGRIYKKKNLARIAQKEIIRIKRKLKKNDTIAGMITLLIMMIYFYEVRTCLLYTFKSIFPKKTIYFLQKVPFFQDLKS